MSQLSKREARINKKNLKALKDSEKSARLREALVEVLIEKRPRAGADPGSIFSMKVRWSCDAPDVEGAWTWGVNRQWSEDDWNGVICPRLEQFSNLTWGEIDKHSSDTGHKMHHNMDFESICEEAQYRLVEIDKFQDSVFRFRLGNLPRLWGVRTLDEFSIIWFDPTHQIYPVD